MEATSQNEQIVVFDLLKKNKMEEYAVDVAPKYHKLWYVSSLMPDWS